MKVSEGRKYRIAWRSLLTDFESHGEYLFDEEAARRTAESANLKHKGVIVHWAEGEHDADEEGRTAQEC